MKKFTAIISVLLVAILSTMLFAGCKQNNPSGDTPGGDTPRKESQTVMSLSLNPEIEFILDGENNVVTVNALNEDGYLIISLENFKGLSAEDAVNLFIKLSKEQGFLVEGSAEIDQNAITVSISGETAQALYDKVLASANSYIESYLDGVEVSLNYAKMQKEELVALVSDCMQELDIEEISAKTEAELIKLLEKSRIETEAFVNEQIKEFYYVERAIEVKKAELLSLIEVAKEQSIIIKTMIESTFAEQLTKLTAAFDEFKAQYAEALLSAEGQYQAMLNSYVEAKQAFLSASTGVDPEILKARYEQAEAALESVKAATKAAMEQAAAVIKQTIETIYSSLKSML
ncbi:MAG: hypothetical protein IJO25_04300, partial [Clostridia bacterium]|nr:hypothetical protein [Clostridia bacterium]